MKAYLEVLDDAAFGAATTVEPEFTSHSDPSSQWTAARKGPAIFACSTNSLIDTNPSVIVGVEASRSIRQAEVGCVRSMSDRVKDKFDLHPEQLIADGRLWIRSKAGLAGETRHQTPHPRARPG